MRKNYPLVLAGICLLVSILTSCSKGGSGGGTTPAPDVNLTVSVNKTSVRADNFDELIITVKDQGNADVTSSSVIRVNGVAISGNKYYASTAGNLVIKATKGSSSVSADVTVTATDPGPSPFTQKLFTEDYTGTWCGYCPRVGQSLKIYSASNPNCIVVGIHGPAGSDDPYNYQYVTQLVSAYGVTGFPTVIVNRNTKWTENSGDLNTELAKRAPLGLGLETSVSGSTINIKAKVKFDVSTQIPMKLIVMLVEDGLVYPQVNYYAPTYGPNPISNYAHKNTLRKAATDIFGDDILAANKEADKTGEKDMVIKGEG